MVFGMSPTLSPPLLSAPIPTQTRLSFCEATPRDLKRWIAGLPKANIGETARQLYQGLGELNQLLTPSDNRLQLLELLRPEVYFVCQHLERHFLHQAIMLDDRSRKIGNLCQALQSHLAIGYKQIVLRITPKYHKDRAALVSQALQRATHALKGQLLRATQLYSPPPEHLWFELHQLYRCACALQLQQRDQAKAYFERSLRLNSRQPRALMEMALLSFEDKQFVPARSYYESYLTLAPHDARSLLLGVRLAKVFEERDNAASLGLQLKRLYPGTPEYQQYLSEQ